MAPWHSDVELLRDIHFYQQVKGGSETILVIFKPELLGRSPLWPAAGRLARPFATAAEQPALAASAGRMMRNILAEMEGRDRAYDGLVRCEILELCSLAERELSRSASTGASARSEEEAEAGFPALERMQLAIDYIYERSAYPISLADAAAAAALSPSYFSRIFAKTVGTNFRAFLNAIRIERAEELMSSSSATLAEIALECGFESVRTFNRSFRALRGRVPSTLRGRGP
jgi:AraC-like DNA-binding protein